MPIPGSDLVALLYGLAAAASWGAGDFNGGLATKQGPVYRVILLSHLVGGALLLGLAFALAEPVPSLEYWLLGGAAGLAGGAGLAALYSGLAQGRMGVVAPVAAVVAAGLPVVVGLLMERAPSLLQLLGFGLAFLAVWLLSRGERGAPIRLKELRLPVAAGVAFGLFFILVDRVSSAAILWPLLAARCTSIALFAVIILVRRQRLVPGKKQLLPIALVGLLDTSGNAFFALAARAGRLDIATVISSLYPAITVLLAWLILKERLNRWQWVGVGAALAALALIAL